MKRLLITLVTAFVAVLAIAAAIATSGGDRPASDEPVADEVSLSVASNDEQATANAAPTTSEAPATASNSEDSATEDSAEKDAAYLQTDATSDAADDTQVLGIQTAQGQDEILAVTGRYTDVLLVIAGALLATGLLAYGASNRLRRGFVPAR